MFLIDWKRIIHLKWNIFTVVSVVLGCAVRQRCLKSTAIERNSYLAAIYVVFFISDYDRYGILL